MTYFYYYYVIDVIYRYEGRIFKEWADGVAEACSFNLKQPLLKRSEENNLIAVNFDPKVHFIQTINIALYLSCNIL